MSTLDVTCSRCDKKFRVRAEFAGKSTRCPGCSAPITIAGAAPPPPPRSEPVEPPRPRPRRRDHDDDEPARPVGDWAPVDMAFRREQVAVVFVLAGIVCDYFAFCLTSMFERSGRPDEAVIGIVILFVVGPSLAAAAFGLMARFAALKTPPESRARNSAVSSLLCGLAGLGCLIMLAISMMISFDTQRPAELPMTVAIAGVILSTLAAVFTFVGFVSQVGIARRSTAVSDAVGRASAAIAVCTLVILGIAILYTLMNELTASPNYPNYGYSRHTEHEVFSKITVFFLLPVSLGVIFVLYHRLLAAGRRALQGEPTGRYDG